MEITASIVVYRNKKEVLDGAVNSFLATNMDVRLYIVDNSPTDEIRLWYKDPRIVYIYNNANIGFGAGHNIVMRDETKMGKYHLVLNPDICFGVGTIETLFQFMEKNPTVGNCMPKILYPDGRVQYLCKLLPTPMNWIVRMFLPFRRIREKMDYFFEMRVTGYNEIMDVPFLSGCFMFLRKTVIQDIGLFDDKIFMYGEDTDLNRRIFQKYRTVFYPYVHVIHNFERGSHKNLRLLWIHICSALYYLNKWGWFFDKERDYINKSIRSKWLG